MLKKIMSVTDVTFEIRKTNPPVLVINSAGKVNTGGWTKGQLIPYVYKTAPMDGVYDFDFIADQPDGPVPEVITDITAVPYEWEDFPKSLNGVRVHASENSRTIYLDPKKNKQSIALDGGAFNTFKKVSRKKLAQLRNDSSMFNITNAFIFEDILHVTVRYGGGCKKHDFKLLWDGAILKSIPPKVNLYIIHNDRGDTCRALITEELQFRLSDLINSPTGILLNGWDGELHF